MKKRKKLKDFRNVNVYIERELRTKFRMIAVNYETSQRNILCKFIDDYIKKHEESDENFVYKSFGNKKRRGMNKIDGQVYLTFRVDYDLHKKFDEIRKKYELSGSSILRDFIKVFVEENKT